MSSAKLNKIVQLAHTAQEEYSTFTQAQVDEIFLCAAIAANNARISLAKEAVKETDMGIIEDKVIKNHFAAEFISNKYMGMKTCGELSYDVEGGLRIIAEPVGVIAGIIPTTNPTSTVIFKALLALKTRNSIVFSPHPRAKQCTIQAAKIILEAAVKAGAPKNIVSWLEDPTIELTQQLMQHDGVALILATGGPGMVKAAYSSGTPAIGVGAGNTPAVVDETADIPMAVSSILISKTFDNGTICASEQSVVAVSSVYDKFKKELSRQGAYILKPQERTKVAKLIIKNGRLNADIVGKEATVIAKLAGITVPETAKILVGEAQKIGEDEPFSYEKLSTVLALYSAPDFNTAVDKAKALVEFGGVGHTAVIYTHEGNQDRINFYSEQIKASRILVNSPSSQGAIGDIYNFRLNPSLTLGCGTYGGNIVSENIEPTHLLNIKSVAERRENMLWFQVPPKIYFKRGCLPVALSDLAGLKKAFIVTDEMLFSLGYADRVTKILKSLGITFKVFHGVKADPDLATVNKGLEQMVNFEPDVIIALGGGSPMDAGKIMWLMYERPDIRFEDIAMRFMDIRKRVCKIDKLGNKASFVAIPTTSGTGSEVTPFAVITDEKADIKYPIADYALTPNIAIIDPDLVMDMPKSLTAAGGIDAVTHAIEAIVAITATVYTTPLAMESLRLLFEYLPASYNEGNKNPIAREKVHYAATIAGMAFANAFLGLCHSMAHKLGSAFHLAHGVANSILIPHIIRFNATDAPKKQGIFSQYRVPEAVKRYADIADTLNLGGKNPKEKVEKLITAVKDLSKKVEIPATIKDLGVDEKEFLSQLDELSELAFDDQCTGTNPRYPLIEEIREIYLQAYYGDKK
jgi:acetaldehyde dehydrogenase/alcohol dehydrogenase